MEKVIIESVDELAVVRLNNGTNNSVTPEVVEDLSDALTTIRNEYRGMVLAGGDKFFCIGLDLPFLLSLNREEMSNFWERFTLVTVDLFTLPLPTACVITGHAPAAGTILACACDFRIAAEGKTLLGLNEIQLGIPVPLIADLMLRQITSDQAANDLLYNGKLIQSEEAKKLNIVNNVYGRNEVEQKALFKIRNIANLSKTAFAEMKTVRNNDIRLNIEKNAEKYNKIFIENWFSDHAQKKLHDAVRHF